MENLVYFNEATIPETADKKNQISEEKLVTEKNYHESFYG